MYQLIYYYKITINDEVVERQYIGEEFRLRKEALQYLLKEVKNEYKEAGYEVVNRVGEIRCYKNEKTDTGARKIISTRIKVEKV